MTARQLLPGVPQKLKDPPFPLEPVMVKFLGWKHLRRGTIVKKWYGYMFTDEKGKTYQCSPGYKPNNVIIVRTGEPWSCYE